MKNEFLRGGYYLIKGILPRVLQIFLRRERILRLLPGKGTTWPIWEDAAEKPEEWPGWPDGKQFAVVLTHDVETDAGLGKCASLIDLEKTRGFRSSFFFVPERYHVPKSLISTLSKDGFEIAIHGLNHDGRLYRNRQFFERRAEKINYYIKEWGAVGFRSPSMHHNFDCMGALDVKYDSSTADTDPFEPQRCGVGTIFPFVVHDIRTGRHFVELPYTLSQDFTLFVLMQHKDISVWRRKLDWIARNGGMALVDVHPDYMDFGNDKGRMQAYPSTLYEGLLDYLEERYEGMYWNALPRDVARYGEKVQLTRFEKEHFLSKNTLLCETCRRYLEEQDILKKSSLGSAIREVPSAHLSKDGRNRHAAGY